MTERFEPGERPGAHRYSEPGPRMTHNADEPLAGTAGTDADADSTPGYTGLAPGVSPGEITAVPTTDATGTPTKMVQSKVAAFVLSSAGLTVLGVIITAATGVEVDPAALAAIVGAVVTGVGGLAGYFTRNRTSAN